MITVYRLKDDKKHIANVQKATLTTKDYGIKQTHGLFGSSEWWNNIEKGTLPLKTLRGTITRVYMGGMNDYPEFEIMAEDGHKQSFTRYCNTADQDKVYQPGRRIDIDFVWQQFKNDKFGLPPEHKVVLEIRIDDPNN